MKPGGALRLLAARLRKLRRDPVKFVEDARSDTLRSVGLGALVAWTHVADVFDVRLWCARLQWSRKDLRIEREPTIHGRPTRWRLVDRKGAAPTCWPERVRVHVRGGDVVLSAFDEDGAFRSGALATPVRPALLTVGGRPCEFAAQFLNPERSGQLVVEPIGRSGVYRSERTQDVLKPIALRRALPPGRPAFARVTRLAYQTWIARNRAPTTAPAAARETPITLLMAVGPDTPAKRLKSAVGSVLDQTNGAWRLRIALVGLAEPQVHLPADARLTTRRFDPGTAPAVALNAIAADVDTDIVAFLNPLDRLGPNALAAVAEALREGGAAAYTDEDRIGLTGSRSQPSFKSKFDYERLLSHNYIGGLFAIRAAQWRRLGGFRPEYDGIHFHDLLLRLSESVARSEILHVPGVHYHRRKAPRALDADRRAALRRKLVTEHLERRQRRPRVQPGPVNRLVWPLPQPAPKVRVIVPTKDRPDLLGPCAAGVLNATDYPSIELVIVDNGSKTDAARAQIRQLAEDPRVSVLERSGPFNFSALCNAAAAGFHEGLLAFVNDDVLIVEPGWLKELVGLALRPTVGAVGAKLFYPDGRIQHAGVVLGLGSEGAAGHEFRGAAFDEVGPQSRLVVTREVSAVTAGCMVVDAAKFHSIGGFDEQAFAVSFNDVDLCLRLSAQGWRALWTPHARLIHLESASRKRAPDSAALQRQAKEATSLRQRWAEQIAASGYYHPALSRADETFSLSPLPGDLSPR